MLKLIVGAEEGKAQNASVPVRWCTDKNTLERLRALGVLNPHLLLVITYGWARAEKRRYLLPLEQAMEYLQFQTPGRNTIYAAIVWANDGKPSTLWETFMRRENNRYLTDTINDKNGAFYYSEDYQDDVFTTTEFAEVDVVVPHEIFAKEPPRWLERWVNLWYETKTRDQCHFRKRMILAFTIQPILVLLWLILRSLIGIAAAMFFILLLGLRNIKLEPIIYPWEQNLGWIWGDKKDIIFAREWTDKKGEKHMQRYLLPLRPIIFVALCIIFFVLSFSPEFDHHYPVEIAFYLSLYMTMMITGFLVICGAIIDAIVHLISYIPRKALEVKREEYKQKYEEFGYLVCDGGVIPNLEALPPKRRTVHLRFMDLRAKVCKPFAR